MLERHEEEKHIWQIHNLKILEKSTATIVE